MNNSEQGTSCDLPGTLWTQTTDKTIHGLVFNAVSEKRFNLWHLMCSEKERETSMTTLIKTGL